MTADDLDSIKALAAQAKAKGLHTTAGVITLSIRALAGSSRLTPEVIEILREIREESHPDGDERVILGDVIRIIAGEEA